MFWYVKPPKHQVAQLSAHIMNKLGKLFKIEL